MPFWWEACWYRSANYSCNPPWAINKTTARHLGISDDFFLARYRFSRKSLIYLNSLLQPYMANTTNRGGPGLSSLQTICVALRFLQIVVLYIMLEMLSTSQSFQMTHPRPDQDFHRPPIVQRAIWLSRPTMPKGAYNRKYKIIRMDLHQLENVRS